VIVLTHSCRLDKRKAKVTKDEVQAVIENADEEKLSIRSLMAKQESTIIITDPREYQLELFEKAKKQNIIAVLDTGESNGGLHKGSRSLTEAQVLGRR
jgi:hypothetical protein